MKVKVNDLDGNPIEIAAVIVWKVVDTTETMFEVDDYINYVHVQSKAALRNRIDPDLLDALRRWASDDLRSLNGQIEFLLRKRSATAAVRARESRAPKARSLDEESR